MITISKSNIITIAISNVMLSIVLILTLTSESLTYAGKVYMVLTNVLFVLILTIILVLDIIKYYIKEQAKQSEKFIIESLQESLPDSIFTAIVLSEEKRRKIIKQYEELHK